MPTSSSRIATTSIVPVTARPERRGVEVGGPGGGDVEGAALDRGDAFGDELRPAFDQARLLGAVGERLARDLGVVGLVGLAEVRGIGVRDRALRAHPVHRGAGVEAAGEGDADLSPLWAACRGSSPKRLLSKMRNESRMLGLPIRMPACALAAALIASLFVRCARRALRRSGRRGAHRPRRAARVRRHQVHRLAAPAGARGVAHFTVEPILLFAISDGDLRNSPSATRPTCAATCSPSRRKEFERDRMNTPRFAESGRGRGARAGRARACPGRASPSYFDKQRRGKSAVIGDLRRDADVVSVSCARIQPSHLARRSCSTCSRP